MNFKNKTSWVAITGAPSSGKTSVIDLLAARGYATRPETARAVFDRRIAAGETQQEIRADNDLFQRQILAGKKAVEAALDPAERVFLDRGLPDSITYFRLSGMDVAEAVEAAGINRYAVVFIFDRLPMTQDGMRTEDEAMAARLDRDIEENYRIIGYDPVRVPLMPVEQRADFILARLKI